MEKETSMNVQYERSIQHYCENLNKLLGDSASNIRELSPDDFDQIDADLKSLEHHLDRGGDAVPNSASYRKQLEDFKLKREVTADMSALSEAA